MEQKVIYKLFLIIGSILMINSSCNKNDIDEIVLTKYHYINLTERQLQMKIYDANNNVVKDNIILTNDTLFFDIITEGGAGPFQFQKTAHGDSIYVNFSNERYQAYLKDFDSIFYEKAYTKMQISSQEYHMFYSFTKEDYDNASLIESTKR